VVEVGDHEDEVRHKAPIVVERMNQDDVGKAFDFNSEFDVSAL